MGHVALGSQEDPGVLHTLKAHFHPHLFTNAQEPTKIKKLSAALASSELLSQFEFVSWYCSWICHIQSWGKGCPCHGLDELDVQCNWKGRRFGEAADFVKREMKRGLDEANEFTTGTFQNKKDECFDLIRCVRATYQLAFMKFEYLWKLPYVLVRILIPGIRALCLEQWNSCPSEAHHRLTRRFLQSGEISTFSCQIVPTPRSC